MLEFGSCVRSWEWCSNHCFSSSVLFVSDGLYFKYVVGVTERVRHPLKSWILIFSKAITEFLLTLKFAALKLNKKECKMMKT